MSGTITLPVWPFIAIPLTYLGVGVISWAPLVYLARRRLQPPLPGFWRFALARPHFIPLQILLWPLAAWEYLR